MAGYDEPIHTMYNIKNVVWKVPQGIFIDFLVSFTLGTTFLLALLYGIFDLSAIINPTISGVSAIEIFFAPRWAFLDDLYYSDFCGDVLLLWTGGVEG